MTGRTSPPPLAPLPPAGAPVLCALSGGADSVYLLLRLLDAAYPVRAAHYNHGLRGAEADRDEAFVRRLCAGLGVPLEVGHGDVAGHARAAGLGVEAAARDLRYAFLEQAADRLGAAWILTAHTADDNAETVLLSLTRGAGTRGLGGIPPRRGRILRPMLGVSRAEVEAFLAARGAAYVEDSTNAADAYARNRVRHAVVPVLRGINPGFVQAAGRAARLLREDEAFLEGLARDFLAARRLPDGALPAAALAAQPRPVASRAVRLAAGAPLSEGHVDAVLALAAGGGEAAFLDLPGLRVGRERGLLRFGAAAPGDFPARPVPDKGRLALPELGAMLVSGPALCPREIHSSFNTFFFKNENICGTISCTPKRDGDRIRLLGRGCTKKLSDLFAEAGLTLAQRARTIVLRDGAGPIAVSGFGAAERCAAAPGEPARRVEIKMADTENIEWRGNGI